ncbi:MAG: hypothetical protein A2177_13415 [Spirochaetes bacterium RBG_13_68_11]|nr:MAG: hypothetical protein A2177_13415 [Spirochaetes bacterium RBG_13_68_11]
MDSVLLSVRVTAPLSVMVPAPEAVMLLPTEDAPVTESVPLVIDIPAVALDAAVRVPLRVRVWLTTEMVAPAAIERSLIVGLTGPTLKFG